MTALALTSRSLFPACAALALGGLLTLLAGSVAAAPAKTKRPPFIEQGETCLPQPLPASVLYLAGDAWKLDAKGNQTPLEEGMDIDEYMEEASESVPSGRVAEPEEVASLALYLANGAASHINGTTIAIDGGGGA